MQPKPFQSLKFKPKIQITLTSLFFTLLVLTCGSIIWFNRYSTEKAYRQDALEDLKSSEQLVYRQVKDFFFPTTGILNLTTGFIQNSEGRRNDTDIKWFLFNILYIYPEYQEMGIAFPNGTQHVFGRILENTEISEYAKKHELKDAAFYIFEHTYEDKEIFVERCILNSLGNEIARMTPQEYAEKDPRKRPWYEKAVTNKTGAWTAPYPFISNETGITHAAPSYDKEGNLLAVAFVDVTLKSLHRFFELIPFGKHGIISLVDSEGSPFFSHISEEKTVFYQNNFKHSPREVFQKLFRDDSNKYPNLISRESIRDNALLFNFSSIKSFMGENWFIGMVAPEKDYVGHVVKANETILWLSVVIFLVATFFIMVFARALSKPILALADDMNTIKNFEIKMHNVVYSWIYEISLMSNALLMMKRGLKAFEHYVPKNLVRKLVKNQKHTQLGGVKKPLTILFSDIYNFTTISEETPLDSLYSQLSVYLQSLTEILDAEQATIDKFIGDGILCFWNAPEDIPDHPKRACSTTLKCKAVVNKLNESWEKEFKPSFHTRFALNYGETLVGNVGSEVRMNYTVMGDSVNTCARLENLGKTYGCDILASEFIYEKTKHDFLYRLVDIVAVRGKQKGIHIYELLAGYHKEEAIRPSDRLKSLVKLSREAFDAYLKREWDEALSLYLNILDTFPEDGVSKVFIERIHNYKKSPPPENWKGVFRS